MNFRHSADEEIAAGFRLHKESLRRSIPARAAEAAVHKRDNFAFSARVNRRLFYQGYENRQIVRFQAHSESIGKTFDGAFRRRIHSLQRESELRKPAAGY